MSHPRSGRGPHAIHTLTVHARGIPRYWRCGSKRWEQYADPILLAGVHLTGPAFLNKMLRALEAPGYALAM